MTFEEFAATRMPAVLKFAAVLACYQPVPQGQKGGARSHVLVLDNGRVAQQLPWLAGTIASQITAFPGITAGGDSVPAFP